MPDSHIIGSGCDSDIQTPADGNGSADDDPSLQETDKQAHFPNDLDERLLAFRGYIENAASILILTHDYPDPDCLASAYGVAHLLEFWGKTNTIISFGGFVGRAENRAMIRFLNINTIPLVLLEIKDYDCIILVDCFPGRNNVSLPSGTPVKAVLDHHFVQDLKNLPFYHDVRTEIGATSTIVTEYLLAAGCPISSKLATALYYGIMTDTGDMGRDTSVEDIECYRMLFDAMDSKLLARIQHPDRDAEFFRILHRGVESMTVYNNVGYVHLGQIISPDYVGEMIDIFHSLEKIEITICTAIFKKNVFFSIRSKHRDEAGRSAEIIAKALNGGGGGHGRAGAGRIPFAPERSAEIINDFVDIFKKTFNLTDIAGKTIV
jgi:nanoRNase/pAp phosphatase (c-di-AMP/oligoRNAs hydrolase)